MALLLVCVLVTVFAGQTAVSRADVAVAPAAVFELELESYEHDFDAPASTAEAHLAVQHRGSEIVAQLEAAQGANYAGVWFDNNTGEFVIPVLGKADMPSIVDALAEDELKGSYRFVPVQHSWTELQQAQAKIDNKLIESVTENLIVTSIDPRSNSVVISEAEGVSADRHSELAHEAAAAAVSVELQQVTVRRFHAQPEWCAYPNCIRPMRGGVEIESSWVNPEGYVGICTAGFKAVGNIYGNRFMLTAGHCPYHWGANWRAYDPSTESAHYLGAADEWTFPGSDWAKVKANGTWWDTESWPSEIAYWGTNQEYPISYESSSYLGETVCHAGRSTGASCGTVSEVEHTANYPEGAVYHTTIFGPVCHYFGDSGGPVFVNNTAIGIFSGTTNSEPLSACNTSSMEPGQTAEYGSGIYTEVTSADQAMGVHVGAAEGAQPIAQTGAATVEGGYQVAGGGTVDPNGLSTTYHFDYGPTNSYGSSTQSWNAGAAWTAGPVGGTIGSLQPSTSYHFRLVATNAKGTSYGSDQQFTTQAASPLATTEGATSLEKGSALLHGTVNPQGADTHYYFRWGATEAYGSKIPLTSEDVGSGLSNIAVSKLISGIKGETTYHYRLAAENEKGVTEGADVAFTTPNWRPSVTAEATTGVAAGNATLHGKVTPQGFDTHYWFEWGATTAYGHEVPVPHADVGSGMSAVVVERSISGLKGQTTYHFRLVGENQEGRTNGSDGTFTTADWRPGITPESPTKISTYKSGGEYAAEATLHAKVNPKGFSTTYQFEYGLTTAYGSAMPVAAEGVGSGGEDVLVGQLLGKLSSGTAYHFRVAATNAEGTSYSQDGSFVTPEMTTLCSVNEASPLCPEANRYAAKTALHASSSLVKITTSLGTVKCTGSNLEGATGADAAQPLLLEISVWSVSACRLGTTECTATTQNLPYAGSLAWTGGANGSLAVGSSGLGTPGWHLACGSGLDCTWGLEASPELQGGNPAQLAVSETTLSKPSGTLCPSSATLQAATYAISAPQPAYVKRVS